jgi:hypothetical protein
MGVGRDYGPTTDHDGRTQRSTTDTSEKWFTLGQGYLPDLGVKGSRVQISPARLSKWPSQDANLAS